MTAPGIRPEGQGARTVRLALGIEVLDVVRGDLADVEVRWENAPPAVRARPAVQIGPYDPGIGLPRLARGQVPGRFRLLFTPELQPPPARLRIVDGGRRYVPRRFEVTFRDLAAVLAEEDTGAGPAGRGRRFGVWPGAAFRPEGGATGVRGRVLDNAGRPVRWVRAEATHPTRGTPLGYAHGDDRGEFLLLLGPPPSTLEEPGGFAFPIRVTVSARPSGSVGPDDPLDDLVPATLALGDPDDLGRTTPADFTRTVAATVPCVLGRVTSPANPFVLP